MRRFGRALVVSVLLLLSVAVSLAQEATPLDLTETFTTDDGQISLDYPADWVIEISEQTEGQSLGLRLGTSQDVLDNTTGGFDVVIPAGEALVQVGIGNTESIASGVENIDADASVGELLAGLMPLLEDSRFTFGEIEETSIGRYDAALVEGVGDESSATLVGLIAIRPGITGALILSTAPDELEQWKPTALAMVESLTFGNLEATPDATDALTPGATLDLTEAHTSGLLRLLLPVGWRLRDSGTDSVYVANTQAALDASFGDAMRAGELQIYLQVTTPRELGREIDVEFTNEDAPLKILQAFVKAAPDLNFDTVATTDVGGKPAAQVRFDTSGFEGAAWAVQYRPGLLLLIQLVTAPGERDAWEATALAIGQNVEYTRVAQTGT